MRFSWISRIWATGNRLLCRQIVMNGDASREGPRANIDRKIRWKIHCFTINDRRHSVNGILRQIFKVHLIFKLQRAIEDFWNIWFDRTLLQELWAGSAIARAQGAGAARQCAADGATIWRRTIASKCVSVNSIGVARLSARNAIRRSGLVCASRFWSNWKTSRLRREERIHEWRSARIFLRSLLLAGSQAFTIISSTYLLSIQL